MSHVGVDFAREAYSVEPASYVSRCRGCPQPRHPCSRFMVGCCLPFTWTCYRPSRSTSKGGVVLCLMLATFALGALFFWGVEGSAEAESLGVAFGKQPHWTYLNSFYFCVIATTTVGFGDFSPSTTGGKVFFIFFAAIGIGVIGVALGLFAATIVGFLESTKDSTTRRMRKRGFSDQFISRFLKFRIFMWIFAVYVMLLLTGACLFGYGNPFPAPKFLNGLYFTFVLLSTIGFGDLVPSHSGTKVWAVVYAILGISIFTFMIGALASQVSVKAEQRRQKFERKREKNQALRQVLQLVDEAAKHDLTMEERNVVLEHCQELFAPEVGDLGRTM